MMTTGDTRDHDSWPPQFRQKYIGILVVSIDDHMIAEVRAVSMTEGLQAPRVPFSTPGTCSSPPSRRRSHSGPSSSHPYWAPASAWGFEVPGVVALILSLEMGGPSSAPV